MPVNDTKLTSHTIDHELAKRLVREVIRRLTDGETDEAIKLDEKVITASMIERIPESKKRLTMAAGAIITPAARDEARRRNISVGQEARTTNQALPNRATDTLSGVSDAASPERAVSIISQLQRRGVKLPKTRIMLSETPGRDVFEQCAKHGQRSVMVTSLADVDRFHAELSPTSWVLDMTRLNLVAATNVSARIAQLED